ncbi:MAG: hypothetical protein SGJ27_26900 [Candidatus Melainabacteria bacterium]|nr:hypothetical protein [Candidatus Melainabacteria bacterium]
MFTFLTLIAIAVVVMVAEVFFGAPAIVQGLFDRAQRLRGYLSIMVVWPLLSTAGGYACATVAGLYFGFSEAWADMGTFFATVMLLFIVGSFFSFVGDLGSLGKSMVTGKPRQAAPGVRVLSSLIFISSMYGSLVIGVLKINGVVSFN